MHEKRTAHTFDTVFTFLLLLAFLLFSLLVAGTGAAIYRKGSDSLNENYTSRTALAYLGEKLRQHDSENAVFFSEVDTCPALTLREQRDGQSYLTYLYYYDGALRELFTREGTAVQPEMGSAIVSLSDVTFELTEPADADRTPSLLLTVTDENGEVQSELVHLMCELSSY